MVEDLDRIVAYLNKRGHLTNISTNGMILAERITDLKKAGISRINLSLYDKNRLAIERTIDKINYTFPVHTSYVLLRSEVEKEPEKIINVARFVHDAGCLSLRFWMYRPMGINPQYEEIIEDTNPAYIDFRRRMEDILPRFCVWPAVVQKKVVKKLCPQLWQRIGCDISGDVGICCGTDEMLQGENSNLFHAEPDVVFNHSKLVDLRRQLLDPKCNPPNICRKCNLLSERGW